MDTIAIWIGRGFMVAATVTFLALLIDYGINRLMKRWNAVEAFLVFLRSPQGRKFWQKPEDEDEAQGERP